MDSAVRITHEIPRHNASLDNQAIHEESSLHAERGYAGIHRKKKTRVIKWDEETIAEHNKERGTRQKIDEPPTPYQYQSASESEYSASESDAEFSMSEKMSDGITPRRGITPLNHSPSELPTNQSLAYDPQAAESTPSFPSLAEFNSSSITGFVPSQISKETRKNRPMRNSPNMIKRKKALTFGADEKADGQEDASGGFVSSNLMKESDGGRNSTSVMTDWTQLQAKLHYEQYQQENNVIKTREIQRDDEMPDGVGENAEVVDEEVQCLTTGAGDLTLQSPINDSDFAKKRAAHYNEFLIIKAMRDKMLQEEEEEEDGEEVSKM